MISRFLQTNMKSTYIAGNIDIKVFEGSLELPCKVDISMKRKLIASRCSGNLLIKRLWSATADESCLIWVGGVHAAAIAAPPPALHLSAPSVSICEP